VLPSSDIREKVRKRVRGKPSCDYVMTKRKNYSRESKNNCVFFQSFMTTRDEQERRERRICFALIKDGTHFLSVALGDSCQRDEK